MRLTDFGRIGVAGLLIAFVFERSVTAQTPPSIIANDGTASDSGSSNKALLVGFRSGSDLFERQWKPTEPSQVGRLVQQPTRARNAVGAVDSTPEQRRKRMEFLQARRESIERRRNSMQPVVTRGPFLSGIQDRIGDGLGPLHNARSCADCHPHGGGSGVEHNVTLITIDPRSVALQNANDQNGRQLLELFPSLLNDRGILSIETVVHDQSTRAGYDEIRSRLATHVPGGIDDAWFIPERRTSQAIARQPVVAGRRGDIDFYLSQRNSPPLYGLGLIDRIPNGRLVALAKKQADESNGQISGRVVMKFGWRGQIDSVSAFVAQACAGELGLTHGTTLQPGDPTNLTYQPPGLDMSSDEVLQLTSHVASIPAPTETTPAGYTRRNVSEGELTFNAIGCVSCHVPDVYPALNIFSDLLLHDMGEALQTPSPAPVGNLKLAGTLRTKIYPTKGPISGTTPAYNSGLRTQLIPMAETIEAPEQPQFPRGSRPGNSKRSLGGDTLVFGRDAWTRGATWDELQREWRTPPLWGIADTAPYLHDGRASTLDEAIRWHGGEARSSRDRFVELNASDKTNVLAFLMSLRAPETARPTSESSVQRHEDTGE